MGTTQDDAVRIHSHRVLGAYPVGAEAEAVTHGGNPQLFHGNAGIMGYPYGRKNIQADGYGGVPNDPPFSGGNDDGKDAANNRLDKRMLTTSSDGAAQETGPKNYSVIYLIRIK